jgi:hypothetical protein
MIAALNKYASLAVCAADAAAAGLNPAEAWENAAAAVFPNSTASRRKGCPKSAFLGLAESGQIAGIAAGKYTRSRENKSYALAALELLRASGSRSENPKDLWKKIMSFKNMNKVHNSQMDVVLALWRAKRFLGQGAA